MCSYAAVLVACIAGCSHQSKVAMPPLLTELVRHSEEKLTLAEKPLPSIRLQQDDIANIKAYIREHPGFVSFRLLFLIEQQAHDVYLALTDHIKANVLCSTLATFEWMTDFGYLHPGGSYDGIAAQELLRVGPAALPCLIEMLDDKSEVFVEGSEIGVYEFRRADFAYRYVMLILGRKPTFHADVDERDRIIADLKKELTAN